MLPWFSAPPLKRYRNQLASFNPRQPIPIVYGQPWLLLTIAARARRFPDLFRGYVTAGLRASDYIRLSWRHWSSCCTYRDLGCSAASAAAPRPRTIKIPIPAPSGAAVAYLRLHVLPSRDPGIHNSLSVSLLCCTSPLLRVAAVIFFRPRKLYLNKACYNLLPSADVAANQLTNATSYTYWHLRNPVSLNLTHLQLWIFLRILSWIYLSHPDPLMRRDTS
jgi:hypothetical protein